jgi:hypothetical protein
MIKIKTASCPGLSRASTSYDVGEREDANVRDKLGHDDGTDAGFCKQIFIISVDAIFTTLFERLFTNVLNVTDANPANACLCRACNAD